MSQVPLFVALHVLGTAVALATGRPDRPALACALGFPIGLAVAVIAALLLLIAGAPYGPASVGALVATVAVGAGVVAARRGVSRRTLAIAAAWTGGFTVVAAALCYRDVALMTFDSHRFVTFGRVIAADGGLHPSTATQLFEWGIFQVVAQSFTMLTAQDFVYALAPVLAVSFVPVFAVTLHHATGRSRPLVVGAVTAALFTLNVVGYHAVYIHSNLGSAVYLFGFVALFWLAEVERDDRGVVLAFISLTAFALQRTENPLVALIFLAITCAPSRLPRRTIGLALAAFAVVVAAWYETLAHHVPLDQGFLTPTRCRLVACALLAYGAWWWAPPSLRRVDRWQPVVAGAVMAAALVAAFALKPDHMAESTRAWLHNLVHLPYWGQAPIAIVVVLLLTLGLAPPPYRQPFTVGIPVFLAGALLLSLGGPPYREGMGDSANRMSLHVLPLIFWYLGLKLVPALTPARYSEP